LPGECQEQILDALQQVLMEPVCFLNIAADEHARVLELLDENALSYNTR